MTGRWVVLAVASLAFFFVTATTFTSLSVVLFTMCAQLHWSMAEGGYSFSLLGLACGLSSPLPAIAIRAVGARWTLAAGALALGCGFLLASLSHGIAEFFAAILLMGAAFSLIAPVPGMVLLPRWFPERTPRFLGVYFMSGSAGGVLGPLLVNASVSWTHDWRLHWALMAGCALLLALLCAAFVRDGGEVLAADAHTAAQAPLLPGWTTRAAVLTQPFLVIALAMVVVQTGLMVVNSSLVAHLHLLGAGPGAGANGIALMALAGTLAKGAAGLLAERLHPLPMLAGSLALGALAFALLGWSTGIAPALLACAVFGTGWGTAWLSAHLLLLRRFGRGVAPDLVALATTLTTLAVVGPAAAGLVADRTGRFAPVFLVVGGLFLLVLAPVLLLRREPGMIGRPVADGALPAGR